ncbi:MAG: aspartate carbamoyltransferase catalytic subunit [Candidatus Kapabacteria bacterium]|nr:aspartate carbamoyltransferase catalytic subunit [Candidatus Kapabacteria bacterium]
MRPINKLSTKSLIDSSKLTLDDINSIFCLAQYYKSNSHQKFDFHKNKVASLLFFEPSTRTKSSFELAAKKLGITTLSLDTSNSSIKKGESFIDTVETYIELETDCFIIRHQLSGACDFISKNTSSIFINAGDGKHDHPTQGLLDAFTLKEIFPDLSKVNITIIGDISQSRVARTNLNILSILGANISILAPSTLYPMHVDFKNINVYKSINEAVENSNVIMCLRLQNERMDSNALPSTSEFYKYYGLKESHLIQYPDLLFMHPGPTNYGVELDIKLKNHKNSLIRKQVNNGLYIRMAVLDLLLSNLS